MGNFLKSLTNKQHILILTLYRLKNFYKNFMADIDSWKKFYDSVTPETEPFPAPYNNLDQMLSLIILKSLRPDKVVPAVRVFI